MVVDLSTTAGESNWLSTLLLLLLLLWLPGLSTLDPIKEEEEAAAAVGDVFVTCPGEVSSMPAWDDRGDIMELGLRLGLDVVLGLPLALPVMLVTIFLGDEVEWGEFTGGDGIGLCRIDFELK